MTLFIGDVHGKYRQYKRILKEHKDTIQVGDMGVGFRKFMGWNEDDPWYPNPPYDLMVETNARFIRGNHDNPMICKEHTQWIPDGTVDGDTMFVGGAVSIDKGYRMSGYTWWEDEELSYYELDKIIQKYQQVKPRIMVTHECPEYVANYMTHRLYKLDMPSITRKAFQNMFEWHQPDIWVYGHWHLSFDETINGTRFVCLNELETKELG